MLPISFSFRGLVPSILRTAPGSALYFYSLSMIRPVLNNHMNQVSCNMISAAVSRSVCGILLTPISVVKVRYEAGSIKGSVYQAFKTVFKEKQMFKGTVSTVFRDAPYASIYLTVYEYNRIDTMASNSYQACLAALVATIVTQPFDVIKTMVQSGNAVELEIKGLFKGVIPRAARKMLSSAITWTVYQELSRP